jgi:hypothetical protein
VNFHGLLAQLSCGLKGFSQRMLIFHTFAVICSPDSVVGKLHFVTPVIDIKRGGENVYAMTKNVVSY